MKTATKEYYKEEETVWHIKDMELLTLIEKSNQALPCDIKNEEVNLNQGPLVC